MKTDLRCTRHYGADILDGEHRCQLPSGHKGDHRAHWVKVLIRSQDEEVTQTTNLCWSNPQND